MEEMVAFVTAELSSRRDPDAAAAMAAYMKTTMPFYGVKAPERRMILREVIRRFRVATHAEYVDAVTALWNRPHREEKYLAVDVARSFPEHITVAGVPLYRAMVVEGAWWDLVDGIAADLVGRVALEHPEAMGPILDEWIGDPNLWLRRTAILAQLRHKGATDEARLFRYCLARAHEREFFIRKAIGWALREYAKSAPDAVRRFVRDNRGAWSGLTYREAAKHLGLPRP